MRQAVSETKVNIVTMAAGAGIVLCWGQNDYGRLGNGTTDNHLKPTPITELSSGVTLLPDGAVTHWGVAVISPT